MKKLLSFLISALLILGMSSCGNAPAADSGNISEENSESISEKISENTSAKAPEPQIAEHVYSLQTVDLPEGMTSVDNVIYSNDKLFIFGDNIQFIGENEDDLQYFFETKLQVTDMNGTLLNEIELSDSDGDIMCSDVLPSGEILMVRQRSGTSRLVKYSCEDGSKISDTALGIDDMCSGILCAADGTIIILGRNVIYFLNENGELIGQLTNTAYAADQYIKGIYRSGGGKIFAYISNVRTENGLYISEHKLAEIDASKFALGEEYPLTSGGTLLNGTGNYDLLLKGDSGLFGLDVESGNSEKIIDWLGVGIDPFYIAHEISVLPDGKILCFTRKESSQGITEKANILTEITDAPKRKLVKLYAVSLGPDIRAGVAEYNRKSTEYQIELTSFNDFYGNYDNAAADLNSELLAGNIPDILITDPEFSIENYISKGLLADINEFIDNDDTIDRDDFLTNAFEAFEQSGRLYKIAPSFTINTLIGKASIVGSEQGWTTDEFIEICDKNAADPYKIFGTNSTGTNNFFNELTSGAVFSDIITNMDFTDRENGICYFAGDDFVKILKFCGRFPVNESDYHYDTEDHENNEKRFRTGDAFLKIAEIKNFSSIKENEDGDFGEVIALKGFPSEYGGSFINADTYFSIISNAQNTDGAWDTVKYFLSDNFQDKYSGNDSTEFPVKVSSLEKQAESFKEKLYTTGLDGKQAEDKHYVPIGGTVVEIEVNTDEDNLRAMEFIKSVNRAACYDKQLKNILTEEAGAYFAGQKTAEETAKIIQNRASNYLAENG